MAGHARSGVEPRVPRPALRAREKGCEAQRSACGGSGLRRVLRYAFPRPGAPRPTALQRRPTSPNRGPRAPGRGWAPTECPGA
eukprot:9871877-Alexandrium_andersonii.AAC.1